MEDIVLKEVSVIIPHHNDEFRLEALIQSVPSDFEVIVVDNNSTHDFQVFKGEFEGKFKNVKVINSPAVGAGGARNDGVAVATGRWLLFADSDDLFLPDLALLRHDIQQFEMNGYDIVVFPPKIFIPDTDVPDYNLEKLYKSWMNNSGDNLDFYTRWNSPWSKLFNSELIKKYGITFEDIPAANDVKFSMNAAFYAKKVKFAEYSIYQWQRRSGSLMSFSIEKSWYRVQNLIWSESVASERYGKRVYREDKLRYLFSVLRQSRSVIYTMRVAGAFATAGEKFTSGKYKGKLKLK